jgi:hypothetical protein
VTAEELNLVALIERRLAEVTNVAVLRLFMPLVEQLRPQQHELDELKAQLANGRGGCDDKGQPVGAHMISSAPPPPIRKSEPPPRRRVPTQRRRNGSLR